MHEKRELAIIIVTWNSEDEIIGCLKSLHEHANDINPDITVIDNDSSDNTVSVIENFLEINSGRINLIKNSINTGFTKACNQGINLNPGKDILLLNPDTKITKNSIHDLLMKLYSDDAAGAVAPQLLNEDGSIQSSCRSFPEYADMFFEMTFLSRIFSKSRIFNHWKMGNFEHTDEREVDQPMGAAILIKSKVIEDTKGFDEQFEMFFNDVDLCKRIYEAGYRIVFFPESKFYHKKGSSIYKDRVRMIKTWNRDCLKYFRKNNYRFVLFQILSFSLHVTGFFRILYHKIKN